VLGQGIIGQFALRCAIAAGCHPVIGIDSIAMRRDAALAAGASHTIDPSAGDAKAQLRAFLGTSGAEVVVDATGAPDAVPVAMSLACDAGQVVVVGSPRGIAKDVNFYDDLHRRYIEVSGAHGNMLFEPSHIRLTGMWDINKAQRWLLAAFASGRLNTERLVTHTIGPEEIGSAYEGLLKEKDRFLGVVVKWKS
jgi:threonine dehydrogenase-like Zn-dependent dehydrogenase